MWKTLLKVCKNYNIKKIAARKDLNLVCFVIPLDIKYALFQIVDGFLPILYYL